MELKTTNIEYIETVQLIEVYNYIQRIIDRVREFDLSEAMADEENLIMWTKQLNEIKRDAKYIDDLKEALLNTATSKMMDFIGDE